MSLFLKIKFVFPPSLCFYFLFISCLHAQTRYSGKEAERSNALKAHKNNNTKDSIYPKFKSEMEQLAEASDISKALSLIREYDDQTIENQIKLTKMEAPSFKEHKFSKPKLFAGLLKEYGADSVWTDSVGNVIALRKGTKREKVLAVAGHMDTVFPEGTDVKVTRSNDTLYAPGIADDNRGLTTVLTIFRVLNKCDIQTKSDILFIGDVGEEGLGDLRGMKYLFRQGGPRIDAFISIEPGGVSQVINGALGSHRYKIIFKGPGGHSWGNFGLANPVHAMGQAITTFVKNADRYISDGIKTSYNVGKIGGGTSINSVPFSAWMEVDMRSLNQKRLIEIDTLFHHAVKFGLDQQNNIRRSGPPLTVDIEMVGNRPSGHTDSGTPLVQRAMAASKYLGENPHLTTISTDSNIPISKGIPAVTLGGGGESGKSHSLHEWFLNKEGYKGIQKVFLVVAAQAGAVTE